MRVDIAGGSLSRDEAMFYNVRLSREQPMWRQKRGWRKFLGLSGGIWYLDTKERREPHQSQLPIILSSSVAVVSVLVSGYLTFQSIEVNRLNTEINRQNFIAAHRPNISVTSTMPEYMPSYNPKTAVWRAYVANRGESEAREVDVFVELIVYTPNGENHKTHHESLGSLLAGAEKHFYFEFAPQELLDASMDKKIYMETYVYFHNVFDEDQPHTVACSVIEGGKLHDCK